MLLGGSFIGLPSGVGFGTDAAAYIPASPNIRTAILISFFMGFFSCRVMDSQNGLRDAVRIIRHESSPSASRTYAACCLPALFPSGQPLLMLPADFL